MTAPATVETTGAAASAPLLAVSDLRVSFPSEEGRVQAVRGISFTVGDGEALGIVGESGSGKSVTSLALMGLLPDHARVSGSIKLRGRELIGMNDRALSKLRGRSISMVFQDPLSALTPVYRVGDQIAETLLVHNTVPDRAAARERAIELLDLVGIPDARTRSRAFPHEFSGGMRQRVVIAMAIANDPSLIICDEPTTALDVTVQAQILKLLRTARDITGAGVIMITHDMGIAASVTDRVAVMYAGAIVESAQVGELFAAPRMPYTAGLLGAIPRMDGPLHAPLVPIPGNPPALHALPAGCTFAPRCPLVHDECTATEPELTPVSTIPVDAAPDEGETHLARCVRWWERSGEAVNVATAFQAADETPVAADLAHEVAVETGTDYVLEVEDLTKTFALTSGVVFKRRKGELRAVDGISFRVRTGRTLALVGESGSGKSTTLTQILNLAKPESGSIKVLGHDTAGLSKSERHELRRQMAIVFQDPTASLDPRLPIFDVVAEPLRAAGVAKEQIPPRVRELMEVVGLRPEHAERYPADFSGGQKQRISIARALALNPALLVLDEPVSSLDVSIQAGVLNLLRELQQARRMSYLFVTHDLSVVRNIAHDVAVMHRGKIVESGTTEQIFGDPQHEYTRELLAAVPRPPAAMEATI